MLNDPHYSESLPYLYVGRNAELRAFVGLRPRPWYYRAAETLDAWHYRAWHWRHRRRLAVQAAWRDGYRRYTLWRLRLERRLMPMQEAFQTLLVFTATPFRLLMVLVHLTRRHNDL